MNKKLLKTIGLIAGLVVFLFLIGVYFYSTEKPVDVPKEQPQEQSQVSLGSAGPIPPNLALGSNTSSTTTGTTTAQLILAAKPDAQLRIITNGGAAGGWLSSTSTGLLGGTGIYLAASSTFTFSGDNLYTGNLYGYGTTTWVIFQL